VTKVLIKMQKVLNRGGIRRQQLSDVPLPSQAVFDFLSQRHNRLCHFISDIMVYILAGKDQQQTNQPNDLAGG